MAAGGVPDAVGMLLTGHHTVNGYGRYDRTKDLQQEAAALVVYNPQMSYEMALTTVSKRFVEEDLKGSSENLKPLIYPVPEASTGTSIISCVSAGSSSKQMVASVGCVPTKASTSNNRLKAPTLQAQAARILQNLQNQVPKQIQDSSEQEVKVNDPPNKLAVWNYFYDGIDWEAAMRRNPNLSAVLGGGPRVAPVANNFSNCQSCNITINIPPSFNACNLDWAKMMGFNKENHGPEDQK